MVLNSCNSFKPYTLTRNGSDQVLNGSVQKSVLLDQLNFPWFKYEYDVYKPNVTLTDALKPKATEIRVLIFAGSWCSDTQRELPRFYKIMDQIGVPENQLGLIMLDQKKKCAYLNVDALQIENIPTFIFYKGGKEIGRVIEKPDSCLELSIQKLYLPSEK